MSIASLVQREFCSDEASRCLIPVDVAAAKAVAIARRVEETEHLPLVSARGRILGGDLYATRDLPPFNTSAMDGYAVRRQDLSGAGPWTLPIGGRLAAGQGEARTLMDSVALRIFTGAPIPSGFDAVIMQERCRRVGDQIHVVERPRDHANIRRCGEDVRTGATLLEAGTPLESSKPGASRRPGDCRNHRVSEGPSWTGLEWIGTRRTRRSARRRQDLQL